MAAARTFNWPSAQRQALQERVQGLKGELSQAVARTAPPVIAEWAKDTVIFTGSAGLRRVKRVWNVGKRIVRGGAQEIGDGVEATQNGRLGTHARERGRQIWDVTKETAVRWSAAGKAMAELLKHRETFPIAMTTIVAGLIASGGPDADGGIPDLDLQAGIGFHRSPFTHSIIAGTFVEGCMYGIATLIGRVYDRLPTPHDPLWDAIERNSLVYLKACDQGMSAGIAYHLLIDGTFQEGFYHHLGIPMPAYAHQAILEANAAAEALDITQKHETVKRAQRRQST